jgi:hypothetical protein
MPQLTPRDANGHLLVIGDVVTMRFVIVGCDKHKSHDDRPARELMTLQAIGPTGITGLTPRLDAIEPGLVVLVEQAKPGGV